MGAYAGLFDARALHQAQVMMLSATPELLGLDPCALLQQDVATTSSSATAGLAASVHARAMLTALLLQQNLRWAAGACDQHAASRQAAAAAVMSQLVLMAVSLVDGHLPPPRTAELRVGTVVMHALCGSPAFLPVLCAAHVDLVVLWFVLAAFRRFAPATTPAMGTVTAWLAEATGGHLSVQEAATAAAATGGLLGAFWGRDPLDDGSATAETAQVVDAVVDRLVRPAKRQKTTDTAARCSRKMFRNEYSADLK
jgi:hypothetical protein